MPNVLYQVDDILYAEVVMELHLRQVEDASVHISIEYDRKRERKTWLCRILSTRQRHECTGLRLT